MAILFLIAAEPDAPEPDLSAEALAELARSLPDGGRVGLLRWSEPAAHPPGSPGALQALLRAALAAGGGLAYLAPAEAIRTLVAAALEAPPDGLRALSLEPGTRVTLQWDGSGWLLAGLSDEPRNTQHATRNTQ